MRALFVAVALGLFVAGVAAQVSLQGLEEKTLMERLRESPTDSRTWVGFAFRRLMESNNYISTGWTSSGTVSSTSRTLEQRLADAGDQKARPMKVEGRSWRSDERVEKRIAVLLFIVAGKPAKLEYQTTDLSHDSTRGPLLWMGEAGVNESFAYLKDLYDRVQDRVLKERLVRVIGLHQSGTDGESAFLRSVLSSEEETGIRRNAAYGLGEATSAANLSALSACARTESSSKVARAAVWAMAGQRSDEATDTLIALLQERSLGSLRREVLQAIANRAAERALPVLQDVIENDLDIDVRRMAVWSLANLADGSGVPLLITLARSETSPTVRKGAIQALAQTKDERATQALIEIIRTK